MKAKDIQVNVRVSEDEKAALEQIAEARGCSLSALIQQEAVFGRVELALGLRAAGCIRFVHAAVLERLEELKRKGEAEGLSSEEKRELGPLAEWLGFLFAPLAEYGAPAEQFKRAAERLLQYVPSTILDTIRAIPEQMSAYTPEQYAQDFYGHHLPSEDDTDTGWTGDVDPASL